MQRFSLILLFICVSLTSIAQTKLSLAKAIELGINTNLEFKLNQLEVAMAEAQIKELKSTGLPQINGSVNYQYYFLVPQQPIEDFITPSIFGVLEGTGLLPQGTYVGPPETFELSFFQPHNLSAGVDARWLIFDGSYLIALEAADLYRELTDHKTEISKQANKNNITKAYLNVLLTDINKATLQNNIISLDKIRYETGQLYKEGFVEQLDLDRLDLSLMSLRTELDKLDNITQIAMNVLKLQIGVDLEEEIILTEDLEMLINTLKLETVNLDEDLDVKELPEYQQIEYGIQLQQLDEKRHSKSKLPTLSAFLSGSESLQRENLFDSDQAGWLPSLSAGLSVSVPIYDGNRRKALIEKSQIAVEQSQVQKQQFVNAKQMEATNAKLQYANAKTTLNNTEKVLEITQSIYDKTLIKYKEGVGSSIEVNQAESEVFSAQSNYINAIYSLVNAKTDLDIALGK